jgi:hypothetical protein
LRNPGQGGEVGWVAVVWWVWENPVSFWWGEASWVHCHELSPCPFLLPQSFHFTPERHRRLQMVVGFFWACMVFETVWIYC